MEQFYYDQLDYTDAYGFVDFFAYKNQFGKWYFTYNYYFPSSLKYDSQFADYELLSGIVTIPNLNSLSDKELSYQLSEFAEDNAPSIPDDIEENAYFDFILCELADISKRTGEESIYKLLEQYEGGSFLDQYEDIRKYAEKNEWNFDD